MRISPVAAVLAAFVMSPAIAADAPQTGFRLSVDANRAAPGMGTGVVQTDIGNTTVTPSAASDAQGQTATLNAGSAQATAGLPLVPGSMRGAASPTPAASASGAEPVQPTPSATPAKVYSTLTEAANDGVDPLGERKAVTQVTPAKPAQPVKEGFDWKDPQAYLAYVKAHQGLFSQAGLGILAAGVILWVLRRRQRG